MAAPGVLPPFPRKCVDLWVEGLNSQASTLASSWHVAQHGCLQTAPEACNRLSRGSKPFGPVTPARPPSRPGRSASAAEAATRQPNGGARVAYYSRKMVGAHAYYSRKMVGAHAVAHHLPRPRRSDQDERLRPHESTRQTQY
eukprot:scaffold20113_cov58-Phaeocystis_antarctica.AAC.1